MLGRRQAGMEGLVVWTPLSGPESTQLTTTPSCFPFEEMDPACLGEGGQTPVPLFYHLEKNQQGICVIFCLTMGITALFSSSCSEERGDMGQSEGSGVRNGNFQRAVSSVTQSCCTHFTTAPAGHFLRLTSQTLPHSGDEWEEGGSHFCFKDTGHMYVEGQSQPR